MHLLAFSQLLQQNAILLATALMNEGGTEMVVSFDNLNIHQSMDTWRRGSNPETFPSSEILEKEEMENYLKSEQLNQIEVLDVDSDIEGETMEGESSIVQMRDQNSSKPPKFRKKSGSDGFLELSDAQKENLTNDFQFTLRKRKKKKRHQLPGEFKHSAPEIGAVLKNDQSDDDEGDQPSIQELLSPKQESKIPLARSSVHLFFDPRDTNAIADSGSIDIGSLFQDMVNGNPEAVRDKLNALPQEARFLLIFRLQRAAQNFIVTLGECK